MRLIIEIDNDVYDDIKKTAFLEKVSNSTTKALLAIQKGDIVYSEERECVPIEGVPLEEMVN